MRKLVLFLFVSLFLSGPVIAEDLQFDWTAGAGEGVGPTEGYTVHIGESSGAYTVHSDVGNVTSALVSVPDRETRFVAVSAYNHRFPGGPLQESGYSNEVVIAGAPGNPTGLSVSSTD